MAAETAPSATEAAIRGASVAHRRLEEALVGLGDGVARRPSRLPGWTVGHVLTHLARNADSHVRALEGAMAGVGVARYPGGPGQREAEIQDGAARSADVLVADVGASIERLEAVWATMPAEAWAQPGAPVATPEPMALLPFKRWREVEVHHVDLGLGRTFEDWPGDYVTLELANAVMAWRARMPMGLTQLPAAALDLPPSTRLAWLLGRVEVDGLAPVPPWW